MIAKIFHKDGRIERSVTFFDGTKMIGAVGSSIKAEKVEDKVPDSYLEPLIGIGVVKTHWSWKPTSTGVGFYFHEYIK